MKHRFVTSITIDATQSQVWRVLADVVCWPEWLPTVRSIEALDGAPLELQRRYRITQPRLRPAVWTVIELQARVVFTWESRSPGVCATARHAIRADAEGKSEVELSVEFSGRLAPVVSWLAGRLTRTYLMREANALKERVESGGLESRPS